MSIGQGARRNIVTLSPDEIIRFRNSIIKLHQSISFPDGVSGWFKQDQIHQATHVHGGPAFLPWHRELCNRFEELLRQVDPLISLHYWDFQQDVEKMKILGPDGIFGASHGIVGPPLDILHNKGYKAGSRDETIPPNPAKPPQQIERQVNVDVTFPFGYSDELLVTSTDGVAEEDQWNVFRNALEFDFHNQAHGYIGGNIAIGRHSAFEDPFVFLLHSNVDRLWASWQLQSGNDWRRDPERIYGFESNHPQINENLEPWAGGTSHPEQRMRPWGIDWPPEKKNSKDISIVNSIPKYDRYTNI